MTDTAPITHEQAEQVFEKAGGDLLDRLPDCIATRAARRNLETVAKYVHEAIEQAPVDQ